MSDLYLIKNTKCAKQYKKDVYLDPKGYYYVSKIADAGFYEEDKAMAIVSHSNEDELVPVTKEILLEAVRQLDQKAEELSTAKEWEDRRHEAASKDISEKMSVVEDGYGIVSKIADKLGVSIEELDAEEKEL